MGEHKYPYSVPWFYWCMRFNFSEHYRRMYESRGHKKHIAQWLALVHSTTLLVYP